MTSASDRRFIPAAGAIVAGLAVELAASVWVHPLAFVAFLIVACPMVLGGMLWFGWLLTGRSQPPPGQRP
jgi:hypothetical protein